MTKEELRQQLRDQFEKHLQENPNSVTVYAAGREPERQPWKKKPSVHDKAFAETIAELEKAD
ncbi:hypothetical protein [Serratia ficaria]|uniref:hypothetical protein n=1 Tax=Serratia ficaria TaxID=61651 RepID=UPI0021C7D382|nr:hypothetical protein [Serratia ficaria]